MAKKKVFQISNALTEGLEETITAAHNYSGELRIEIIPLKRIEVDPDNPRDLSLTFTDVQQGLIESDSDYPRKSAELSSLQTIAHSIREQGIINPIVVYKYGDKYRLVAGERRTLASLLAGKTEIQAKILDTKPSELKISLLQWIENVERSDLSLWERLRNLEKIVTTYAGKKGVALEQVTSTELCHLIGCTKPHALNYKEVLLASADIKLLIQENKIKNLEKAALIAGIQVTAVKQTVLNACLAGASLKKLRLITEQENRQLLAKKPANKVAKRGRQATSVNLGMTKNIKVAQAIAAAIVNQSSFSHLTEYFAQIDWSDYQAASNVFKQLVQKLEELHA